MLRVGIRQGFRASTPSCVLGLRYHSHRTGTEIRVNHDHGHEHGHIIGHSHSHGHESVELLTAGSGLRDPSVRITWIGLFANVGMAVGKGIGGVVFHSQSLIADSIHAVTDLVSDFLTLATVSVARKPTSTYFPNGYGRIEAIGAFGVSSLLLAAGASMGWGSLITTIESLGLMTGWVDTVASYLPGHTHDHNHGTLADWNAAWIGLASIVIKESLFQATYRIGLRTNSNVLIANAWHHRIDCLASGVAVISIAGGQLFNVTWLDPLGGLIVSAMILKAGWGPTKESFMELAGSNKAAMHSETFEKFQERAQTALSALDPEYNIVSCRLDPYGSTYVGYVHLSGIKEGAGAVAEKLRKELLQIPHMKAVNITI